MSGWAVSIDFWRSRRGPLLLKKAGRKFNRQSESLAELELKAKKWANEFSSIRRRNCRTIPDRKRSICHTYTERAGDRGPEDSRRGPRNGQRNTAQLPGSRKVLCRSYSRDPGLTVNRRGRAVRQKARLICRFASPDGRRRAPSGPKSCSGRRQKYWRGAVLSLIF
jgi:hypothetical protein